MSFLSWFGLAPETRSETPPEAPVIPPRSDVAVTDSRILGTIAVYRAVQILSVAAGQLTLDAWRGDAPIERPALLRKPDATTNLSRFLKSTVASMALTGNAYWRIYRNARNEPVTAVVQNPHDCTLNDNGTLSIAGQNAPLPRGEFAHLGLLPVPGRLDCLGPIQAARKELGGAVETTDYAANWFKTGDVPSGVLKSDQVLSPEQAAGYKTAWQNRDPRSVAVLGHGLDYSPVALAPEDAQWIQARQFDVTAIARLFGIPAHLMLAAIEGSSMTYSNISQADLVFVRWTLMAYLTEIEQAFSDILAGQQTARFNLDAILRPDTLTRYEAHKIALEGGWLTVDDVKRIEGIA